MDGPDTLSETRPSPGFPATRDDFPYSLQAYAAAGGGEAGTWSLFLYRAAAPAEREWLLANGFTLQGRLWVRTAEPESASVSG